MKPKINNYRDITITVVWWKIQPDLELKIIKVDLDYQIILTIRVIKLYYKIINKGLIENSSN